MLKCIRDSMELRELVCVFFVSLKLKSNLILIEVEPTIEQKLDVSLCERIFSVNGFFAFVIDFYFTKNTSTLSKLYFSGADTRPQWALVG